MFEAAYHGQKDTINGTVILCTVVQSVVGTVILYTVVQSVVGTVILYTVVVSSWYRILYTVV